jgi:hypothetical protein
MHPALKAVLWIVIILVVLVLGLFISAFIAGFTSVYGVPVPFANGANGDMITWIMSQLG